MARLLTLALLVLCSFATLCQAAERRLLEPEEWEGLKRVPFFQENAPGWYALEAHCRVYGAVGKGYAAMIHEGATRRVLSTKLQQPLPPGKYKVFVSSMGLFWSDKTNIVSVRVGAAQSKVEWSKRSNKFVWFEGTPIELTQTADRIELEAVQFGGKGFAMLYDPASRSIPIDQIYITSDLTEKSGPSLEETFAVQQDRDAHDDTVNVGGPYRKVLDLTTPAPVQTPAANPIALRAFEGSRNLLPNSSFELGGGDGWSTANNSRSQSTHICSEHDHVRGDAVDGEYALRLPGKGVPMGLQFSRVFYVQADGVYTLSGYMKSLDGLKSSAKIAIVPLDGSRKMGNPLLSSGGKLTNEFQRFVASGELKAGPLVLAVYGACLLDAVQLELGDKVTPYAPRATVEASLTTDQLGHILYSDKPVTLAAWARNAGSADAQAKLHYRVVDVREQVIAEADVTIPVAAGKTVQQNVVIAPTLRGIFNATYSAQGRSSSEGELIYSVLPPLPTSTPRHALASNMDNDPASMELMQRMGHQWQLYCKLNVDKPVLLNPAPGEYRWDEARKMLFLPEKFSMKTMPALWPNTLPAHLRDAARSDMSAHGTGQRDMVRFIKGGKAVEFPDLDQWRKYCQLVAENLGDRQPWWTIHDETEMYYSPREFARISRATVEGFKASGKDMKISLSCMGDYIEEVIAELGGENPFAGFGSSSYDYEYWETRKVRYLQQRFNVPWSCIGVGVAQCPAFRRTAPFGEPVFSRAVATAQEMVLLAISQDAKVIGHYSGRLWFSGAMSNRDYPLMDYDGTPLVHGYVYSAVPLLVADAEPVVDVELPELRTIVFVYRQNGRLHAVTWANNHPGLDIHWKTDPQIWRDLTLTSASGSLSNQVIVADMFGNDRAARAENDPRRARSTSDGKLVFDLDEEPVFLLNRGLSDEKFLNMIRSMTAKPRPMDLRLAFLPNGRGGVDLGVHVQNNTGSAQQNLKLDANFPPNRMLNRVDWSLPQRDGKISDIAAGGQTWGRISTSIGADFPIENATYTAWVTQADGSEHRMYENCWLTVAPKTAAAKIDGKLDEWDKVQPAWMYYTYAWARFGRHITQFVSNGEHFKYVHHMDARAAIYTSHDANHLYVAVRCEDDDPIFSGEAADQLEIVLNAEPGAVEKSRTLILQPRGQTVDVSWRDGASVSSPSVVAAMTTEDVPDSVGGHKAFTIEVAIPLQSIGTSAQTGQGIGFDVVWHDADHDGPKIVTGTWRWAGRSTSLGTLLFGR